MSKRGQDRVVHSDELTPDQALEGHAQCPEGAAEVAQTAFLDSVQDPFMVATSSGVCIGSTKPSCWMPF